MRRVFTVAAGRVRQAVLVLLGYRPAEVRYDSTDDQIARSVASIAGEILAEKLTRGRGTFEYDRLYLLGFEAAFDAVVSFTNRERELATALTADTRPTDEREATVARAVADEIASRAWYREADGAGAYDGGNPPG